MFRIETPRPDYCTPMSRDLRAADVLPTNCARHRRKLEGWKLRNRHSKTRADRATAEGEQKPTTIAQPQARGVGQDALSSESGTKHFSIRFNPRNARC